MQDTRFTHSSFTSRVQGPCSQASHEQGRQHERRQRARPVNTGRVYRELYGVKTSAPWSNGGMVVVVVLMLLRWTYCTVSVPLKTTVRLCKQVSKPPEVDQGADHLEHQSTGKRWVLATTRSVQFYFNNKQPNRCTLYRNIKYIHI